MMTAISITGRTTLATFITWWTTAKAACLLGIQNALTPASSAEAES